jgi:peptidoglycan/LPS O-acetylase OafA/YrhL
MNPLSMTPGSWRPLLWLAIAVVLLFPLVAMQVTDEVRWTATDFAAATVLLGGGALLFEVAARRLPTVRVRWIAGGAIALVVALVWAEGAVGIV